jgi:spore germination protein
MKITSKIVLVIFSTMVLSGCMNAKPKILDDLTLATAVGYDYVDKKKFRSTWVAPTYMPDKTIVDESYTATSTLSKEVRAKINQKAEKQILSGKFEVALYSKKLAQNDISNLIDTLQRDPSIGANVFLAVVDGTTHELLVKQSGNSDKGIYLSNLFEQNIKLGSLPKTNLQLFLYAFYAEGRDPILPQIKALDGKVDINGIALFNKGKYVGLIKKEQIFAFNLMHERKSNSESFAVDIGKKEYASLFNITSKRTYDIPKPMTTAPITIKIKVEAILREYSGGNVDKAMIKKIEKAMKKDIEEKANRMIKKFQKLKIDPLGVGEQVRTRTRKWDMKKFDKQYPTLPIKVEAKVKVIETGVIE